MSESDTYEVDVLQEITEMHGNKMLCEVQQVIELTKPEMIFNSNTDVTFN